jgi:hypothetical protein
MLFIWNSSFIITMEPEFILLDFLRDRFAMRNDLLSCTTKVWYENSFI